MSSLQRLIPSMFHRRLALLYALICVSMLGLTGQLANLTLVEHDELLALAQRPLVRSVWEPTVRGRILDRKGRVLAIDRPAWEIAVDYRVITGKWAYDEASERAWAEHRDSFLKFSEAQRDAVIAARFLPAEQERVERLWQDVARITNTPRDEVERLKADVLARVQRATSNIWEARRLALEQSINLDREPIERRTVETSEVARPLVEQRAPHVLLSGLSDEAAFAFRRVADEWPGGEVQVRDAHTRLYPMQSMELAINLASFPGPLREDRAATVQVDGVATHILGWMRDDFTAEDVQERGAEFDRRFPDKPEADAARRADRGRYLPGDSSGATGIEAEREFDLRGLRGRVSTHLDTGEVTREPARAGHDIPLTIDVALQARIQGLLDPELGLARVQPWHGNDYIVQGTPLAAGVAVIDVASGDVLALVSTPSFTREALQDDPEAIFGRRVRPPWVNRPLAAVYPPGSIVKPLVYTWAVSHHGFSLGRAVECHGHLYPNHPERYRCWIFRERFGWATHTQQVGGALRAEDALARSCNIFFNTIGRELGPHRIAEMYAALGVGRPPIAGFSGGSPGLVGYPDPAQRITDTDAIMMGIGQGPIAWTPLHSADAYATLARNGERLLPRLDATFERTPEDLDLDRAAIKVSFNGLRAAAEEPYGTGHHITFANGRQDRIFNTPGVTVYAKTGTAEAPRIPRDPAAAVREVSDIIPGKTTKTGRSLDDTLLAGEHSWTTALVGPTGEDPQYAISVLVEYAGSGGRVSGPIVNQVVHALVAEGYLPDLGPPAPLDSAADGPDFDDAPEGDEQ